MNNGKNIPLSVPLIQGNEWKYVKECLDAGWVSSIGEYVNKFERAVAGYAGCNYAVATVNGTSALHVSLASIGTRPGDEVIVPALTFVATANVVRYCGAEPVFMDCDKETLCIDAEKTKDFLEKNTFTGRDGMTFNKRTGRPVRAIIPVHIFGHPADMERLLEMACEYNLTVIEDASESIGSEYKGRQTGTFGKAGCYSFNGNKIITTGGGGMVVTDDEVLSMRIRHLTTQARSDIFEYDHDETGFNFRLTNIQAAMGLAQMERLDEYVDIKRRNAALYKSLLFDVEGVELFWEKPSVRSNFWYITVKVSKGIKEELLKHLLSKGVQARPVWKPLHTLPMYKGCESYAVHNAGDAYERCLNLPCSVGLKEEEIEYVVKIIKDYLMNRVNKNEGTVFSKA